jgi:hypothetical protein
MSNNMKKSKLYIVADAKDNSISFSKDLYKMIRTEIKDKAKVMVFTESGTKKYAFMVNPEVPEETPLQDIQVNQKYNSIGFQAEIPTVNRIFYDYGISADKEVALTVIPQFTKQKKIYYRIENPKQ